MKKSPPVTQRRTAERHFPQFCKDIQRQQLADWGDRSSPKSFCIYGLSVPIQAACSAPPNCLEEGWLLPKVGEKKNAALRAGSAPTRAQTEMVARFQTTGDRAGDRLTLDITQAGPS